jgi:hypothetical protein
METDQQMNLRHAMEKAKAEVSYFKKMFWQAYVCFTLAVLSLGTGVVLGPLGVVPEGMAWGVGIVGTIIFGVLSLVQFGWVYDENIPDLTARRHAYECAEKRYYDVLAESL